MRIIVQNTGPENDMILPFPSHRMQNSWAGSESIETGLSELPDLCTRSD
jgi:hypothetical protein